MADVDALHMAVQYCLPPQLMLTDEFEECSGVK